jgi:hypothetical protein
MTRVKIFAASSSTSGLSPGSGTWSPMGPVVPNTRRCLGRRSQRAALRRRMLTAIARTTVPGLASEVG